MRQKNYKWLYYVLIVIVLGAVVYIATKDISPITHHVEQDVSVEFNK